MPLDIAGATIQSSNTSLSIIANSITGFNIDASNRVILSNRPSFFVESTPAGWTNFTNGSWAVMPFNTAIWNNGSCYSTSTNAFTAPVSGVYYFTSSLYFYKNTSTNADSYVHPGFWVNGSSGARAAGAGHEHRIRGRTYYSSSYSHDTQINNIYRLTAGDYVQLYVYGGGALQWYATQNFFSGALIG
jgi:hypothetical protein